MSRLWQVTHENRIAVAMQVGGQPWADGVIVTMPDGSEKHVKVGTWLVQLPDGTFVELPA